MSGRILPLRIAELLLEECRVSHRIAEPLIQGTLDFGQDCVLSQPGHVDDIEKDCVVSQPGDVNQGMHQSLNGLLTRLCMECPIVEMTAPYLNQGMSIISIGTAALLYQGMS